MFKIIYIWYNDDNKGGKQLNSITLEELRSIVPIQGTRNIQNEKLFDYFHIVNFNNKKVYLKNIRIATRVLDQ